ncbi:MAG: hypothetical protein IV092_21195 [Burkholderiaceae bacterium]|nr:hypothetical protein [Burkholderiaceae bacterium]
MSPRHSEPVVLKGLHLLAQPRRLGHPQQRDATLAQDEPRGADIRPLLAATPDAIHPATIAPEPTRADGFSLGYEEGLTRASQEMEQRLEALRRELVADFAEQNRQRARQLAAGVDALKAALRQQQEACSAELRRIEPLSVALAFEALCKLLGDQTHRRELLKALIAQGLKAFQQGAPARILLNAQDWQLIADSAPSTCLPQPTDELEISADSSLEPGCCLLQIGRLQLDISMSTQLDRLMRLWATAADIPAAATADEEPG